MISCIWASWCSDVRPYLTCLCCRSLPSALPGYRFAILLWPLIKLLHQLFRYQLGPTWLPCQLDALVSLAGWIVSHHGPKCWYLFFPLLSGCRFGTPVFHFSASLGFNSCHLGMAVSGMLFSLIKDSSLWLNCSSLNMSINTNILFMSKLHIVIVLLPNVILSWIFRE